MSTEASAKIPTPIYNTPAIPFLHLPLKKDSQGRLMELETIALPGTRFVCIQEMEGVFQVETAEYPSSTPLYVDKRCLHFSPTPEREKRLPSAESILAFLEKCKGSRYLWGGNWNQGIDEMLRLYPPLQQIDEDDALCRGVDCSGLLYQATNGITHRNTSGLISYGEAIEFHELRPLDLMVWKGHVLIVLSPETFIESRIGKGVVITDLKTRYQEALDTLQGKPFFLRRWYPN